jgi:DNA mismatch repair protein MutS2
MLRDICARAGTGSLVLVDEIAADTNPKEGAALATAVIDHLLAQGAMVLVTTHLEELKALAHTDARFVNARVGFDSRKMAPTYRLQIGAAGSSSAIEIARRIGLPAHICAKAESYSTGSGGALSQALSAAEDERRRYAELRAEAERDAAAARLLVERSEVEKAQTAAALAAQELKFREALRAELEFARKQIRALVEKLEADTSRAALKSAKQASAELAQRASEHLVAERALRAKRDGSVVPLNAGDLRVGARVRHTGLNVDVEVLAIEGDDITIMAGAIKMRVPASVLATASARGKKAKTPEFAPSQGVMHGKAEQLSAQALTLASPTLDLRGQRADDALRQVEHFLDRLTREGEDSAIVIHGHGTGALKREIRDYLQSSPYVKSFRPGDDALGSDGVTVIVL